MKNTLSKEIEKNLVKNNDIFLAENYRSKNVTDTILKKEEEEEEKMVKLSFYILHKYISKLRDKYFSVTEVGLIIKSKLSLNQQNKIQQYTGLKKCT